MLLPLLACPPDPFFVHPIAIERAEVTLSNDRSDASSEESGKKRLHHDVNSLEDYTSMKRLQLATK